MATRYRPLPLSRRCGGRRACRVIRPTNNGAYDGHSSRTVGSGGKC